MPRHREGHCRIVTYPSRSRITPVPFEDWVGAQFVSWLLLCHERNAVDVCGVCAPVQSGALLWETDPSMYG